MKIKKLNLTAFGGFTEKTFDFSEPNKSFYLIEGPNEAGKSTTLRAIKTALFGFERNAKDDYIHLKENLRVGISLIKGSHELNFIRRRGNKNTIQAADLLVMADNAISQFCSILENKNLFCRMFGLDHQTLVSGGEDILNNGSDAGQSIFEAGSGILGLNNLLNDLKSKAAALFTTGSRSRIIDQLLLSYKSLASEKKQSQLKPEDWEKINSELLNNDEQLRGIVKKIQTLKVESNKLDKDLFLKEQISTIIRLGNELENLKKISSNRKCQFANYCNCKFRAI
jgi:uncharacterized protein YhaN